MFKLKTKYTESDVLSNSTDFTNKEYLEVDNDKIVIEDKKIDECIFKKIDFNNVDFLYCEFIDTLFEDCIITNKNFDKM